MKVTGTLSLFSLPESRLTKRGEPYVALPAGLEEIGWDNHHG